MSDFTTFPPRPTVYRGVQMRSRLEATMAQALDTVAEGDWLYEPLCYADESGQYLPDFYLNTPVGPGQFFEVKHQHADHWAALRKMHIIRKSEPTVGLVVAVPQRDPLGFALAAMCIIDPDWGPWAVERFPSEQMCPCMELLLCG